MFTVRLSGLAGLFFALFALLLAGCNCLSNPPSPVPNQAVLNGYTTNPSEGSASFSLSALDDQGNVITSGTVSNPQVLNLRLVQGQGTVQGTATICGQISGSRDPINCVVTLDATGSMSWSDPNRLRADAAKSFIDKLRTTDKAAVGSFDDCTSPTTGFYALHLWQDFTNDKVALKSAVDQATFEGCATNLWDATYDSVAHVAHQGQQRLVLVLTDGYDNSSYNASPDTIIAKAQQENVKVYMIGLGQDPTSVSYQEMQRIAGATGGLYAFAGDPNQLNALFNSVFYDVLGNFCIKVVFQVNGSVPAPGTTIAGTLSFTINNKPFQVDFQVTF